MTPLTKRFLEEMRKAGYRAVAIKVRSAAVPQSIDFPWPKNSVFGKPNKTTERADWPPIWAVANALGIAAGCGNSHQYQVRAEADLTPGAYVYRKGEWRMV